MAGKVIPIIRKIDMDDGSLPLAKSILTTLAKTKASGTHHSIINVIIHETYGWYDAESPHTEKIKKRRTKAQISFEKFTEITWIGEQELSRAISQLLKYKVIGRDKNTNPYTYWFNVNVHEWSHEFFRVNRIANTKNDVDQQYLSDTTSQDSKDLADLQRLSSSAKSLQDSEESLSSSANSSQDSAIEPVKETDLLKKVKKDILIKINSVSGFQATSLEQVLIFFEQFPREKQLDMMVKINQIVNANKVKEVGFMRANIRCRDCFDGAMGQEKVTAIGLLRAMFSQTKELTPWEIVKQAEQPPPKVPTEKDLELESWAEAIAARKAK